MSFRTLAGHFQAAFSVVVHRKEGEPLLGWVADGASEGGKLLWSWVTAPDEWQKIGTRAAQAGGSVVLAFAVVRESPTWGLGAALVGGFLGCAWLAAGLLTDDPQDPATGEAGETEVVPPGEAVVAEEQETGPVRRLRTVSVSRRYDVWDERNWTPPPQSESAPF